MLTNRILLFSLIHILTIFRVSLLETVHFTNSPHKILKANNFTTYKVEVPNGDPITIIEGSSPLIDKKIQFNEIREHANTKYSINHHEQRGSHVVDLKTSLGMTVTPDDYHHHSSPSSAAAYEHQNLSPSAVGGDEESVANDNDYRNMSPEQASRLHQGIKTVYSPQLLEKFLKDYQNKILSYSAGSSAAAGVDQGKMKNPLENVSKYTTASTESNVQQNLSGGNTGGEDLEEEEDTNRRVSSVGEDSDASASNDIKERKQYRPTGYGYGYSNKNSGWVSLDPVPWSKTKISKWQSFAKPHQNQNNPNLYNYQPSSSGGGSGNGGSSYSSKPPSRPTYSNYDDDDYAQRPGGRPVFHNNQFYMTGYVEKPSSRPPPPPPNDNRFTYISASSAYDPHESSHHHQQPGYQRPSSSRPDIITDNRPSSFPQHSGEHQVSLYRPRPDSYDRPSRPFNDYQFSSSGSSPYYSNKDTGHPVTYPNSGADGEWVLVSTTKGYQSAKRHGQRAMILQTQNGFTNKDDTISTGIKSGSGAGIITASASQPHEFVIKPPQQHGPTKLMNQQMKLTVLPLKVVDRNYQSGAAAGVGGMEVNKVYQPSSYNGIIEADPSPQTIEESVAAAAHANEQNSMVMKPTKKKVRKYNKKNYAIMRKNSENDSATVLAAVGAGLLPASIGLIAPMMLGR